MTLEKTIFKSYDVRGIYPSELNEEVAYSIGKVLAGVFGGRAFQPRVAVGRDMRLSGEKLFEALTRGFQEAGANVYDLGLVPIDAVYFSVDKLDYDGGVMVTASHNPKEYNGFKMIKRGMEWVRGTQLLDLVQNEAFPTPVDPGSIEETDIWPDYIKHLLGFIDISKIKPLRVVVDAGNGMAGKVMPILAPSLPIQVLSLFFELDGSFPNHPSNPLEPQSQVAISRKVLEMEADFGVIFDGDTDRLFFIDERGEFIRADMTLLLLARLMLEREPGAAIVYNLICSRVVPEKIEEWGGRPIRSAVGFVNVASNLRKHNGIMGGELSAHYSFRDNGYADSGFIAFLILLQLLSESSKKLSELIAPFKKYFKGDEINFRVQDATVVIDFLKDKFGDGRQDELDGLTVQYPDWWFNVRPSNTEPLLRITIEAATAEMFEEKQGELKMLISQFLG